MHSVSKHMRLSEPTTKISMEIDYTVSDDDVAQLTLNKTNCQNKTNTQSFCDNFENMNHFQYPFTVAFHNDCRK